MNFLQSKAVVATAENTPKLRDCCKPPVASSARTNGTRKGALSFPPLMAVLFEPHRYETPPLITLTSSTRGFGRSPSPQATLAGTLTLETSRARVFETPANTPAVACPAERPHGGRQLNRGEGCEGAPFVVKTLI